MGIATKLTDIFEIHKDKRPQLFKGLRLRSLELGSCVTEAQAAVARKAEAAKPSSKKQKTAASRQKGNA